MRTRVILAAAGLVVSSLAVLAPTPVTATPSGDKKVIVQLFQWKWSDVAKECESTLGPKGFGGVQISPPHEHISLPDAGQGGYPWWQDYQPVTYPNQGNDDADHSNDDYSKLKSRRGDAVAFKDMVDRCHAKGVKIYADALVNHMTNAASGVGSGGTAFTKYNYPGLYQSQDFHDCREPIGNRYGDRWVVQNCELESLADLKTESSWVQGRIGKYLYDLVALGVDGFRLDASKHMPTADIGAILTQMRNRLNADSSLTAAQKNPYIYQEVLYGAGEPIKPGEYRTNGDVKDMQYGRFMAAKFWSSSDANNKLHQLHSFPNNWGDDMGPSDKAIVTIDNHDSQRDALSGTQILTYKDGATYKLANAFMLAWDYGTPLLMSSFAFTQRDTSPPTNGGGTTKDVSCTSGEWVCEHRYSEVADMVGFRNAVEGTTVNKADNAPEQDWYSDYSGGTGNKIAFSRGDKGYVVFNRDQGSAWNRTYKTRLPAGKYCNVIGGDYNPTTKTCKASHTYTVAADGSFSANVPAMTALALHVGATVEGTASVSTTFTVSATPAAGQDVYVVGNVSELGSWAPASAIKLTSAGNNAYSGVVDLPKSTAVQYKYIKKNAAGTVTWESGDNRSTTTPATGTHSLTDVFRGDVVVSSIATTFNVNATTSLGQNVFVVGNIAELGNWAPASAVALSAAGYPVWSGTLNLPSGKAIEYKFIKKNADGSVTWESGANRTLTTPASGTHTTNDTWK